MRIPESNTNKANKKTVPAPASRRGGLRTTRPFSFSLVFFVVAILVTIVPFLYNWLFGACGPVDVGSALKEFAGYQSQLAKLESAIQKQSAPQPDLISQIEAESSGLSQRTFDACIQPAANAIEEAMLHAANYYTSYQQGAGISNSERDRLQYQADLRTYEAEISKLRACQPLCNMSSFR